MEHKLANDGKIYNIVQIRKYTETSVQCGTCCQITNRRENGGASIPVTKTTPIFFVTRSFWQYLKCQVSINKMVNIVSIMTFRKYSNLVPRRCGRSWKMYSPQEYIHNMVGENLKTYGAFFKIPSEACGMFKKGVLPTVDMILQN